MELYWSPKGALKDEFLDFMLLCFSSVLAPKSLQNGLQSGPGGAPGCPGGGPGGPGGGSDVQMSISEAPECRAEYCLIKEGCRGIEIRGSQPPLTLQSS